MDVAMVVAERLLSSVLFVTFPAIFSECIDKIEQIDYINESVFKLVSMGDRLPKMCRQEALRLSIKKRPKLSIYKIWALEKAFNLSSELFNENLTEVTWNSSNLLELRELLARQTIVYSKCFDEKTYNKQARQRKRIENYFKILRKFLQTEKFTACAWEVVRADLIWFYSYPIQI